MKLNDCPINFVISIINYGKSKTTQRDKVRLLDFGEEFIQLAQAVYFSNDKRSEIKRKINILAGSKIIEEKSYSDY